MNTIKKYAVSIFVVGAFLLYTYYQQLTGDNQAARIHPLPLTNNTAGQPAITTELTGTSGHQDAATTAAATPPPSKSAAIPKPKPASLYQDGTYTGSSADAYYGNVQVQVTVQDGKISDIQFLDYPQDRNRSIAINSNALPILRSEAIQAQSATVDTVSGATDTSGAFRESLSSALALARN